MTFQQMYNELWKSEKDEWVWILLEKQVAEELQTMQNGDLKFDPRTFTSASRKWNSLLLNNETKYFLNYHNLIM